MDRETEQRTRVTGAAFKLLVSWLRNNDCRCEVRRKYSMETPCSYCRNAEEFKKAFPLEWGAACEFVVMNPREKS